jgi:hypothetical protein
MFRLNLLQAFAAILLFAGTAAAQITGLCNTGQTSKTISGCTGVLVTPNPGGGGSNRDGNWQLAYPYPSTLSPTHGPCDLRSFVKAWVDTPDVLWLSNGVSSASEWITPYDGDNSAAGWYVYRTAFHLPSLLPGGIVPTGLTINGQLASDNATYAIYLESPADSGSCSLVSGLPVPINPAGSTFSDFDEWWPFSFTNSVAIIPGTNAYLYVVVLNLNDEQTGGPSNTGLRVEFFASSAFN